MLETPTWLRIERSKLQPLLWMFACFYVAPAQAEWSMIVLPDTQNYFINMPHQLKYFEAQTQWAVDTKSLYNTQIVVGTGDIISNNVPNEWVAAAKVMSTLDGQLPYILPLGNHDYSPIRVYPQPGEYDSSLINTYFPSITHPTMIEMQPGRLENTYTRFVAPDGRKVLLFSLETVPRVFVTDWAKSIADQFPRDTVMLTTHINMEEGLPDKFREPTSKREAKGNELWEQWTSLQPNLELILNGHAGDGPDTNPNGWMMTARQTSLGVNGNRVTEIGFNTQDWTPGTGGGGWLRLYTFLDDGQTVQVRTYSPYLDTWITDNRNEFQFQLTPLFSADFDGDRDVDGRDFLTWQRGFGSAQGVAFFHGDANIDEKIDSIDLAVWQQQYSSETDSIRVPEPQTIVLVLAGWALIFAYCRH